MKTLLELFPVVVWAALWAAGGWLLVRVLFRLRSAENELVGLATGLILEVWLSNLLAHVLPIAAASWLAALLLCVAGGAAAFLRRTRPGWSSSWRPWAVLASLFLIFTLIGRGLGIFDDYQNLPTVSLMATGDVPPHFALNPSLNFGYHYFLLLFASQLMRLGGMFPWTALDTARGLMMALPLVLAAVWALRVTRNHFAAALTAAMLAFAGGARWLLLLFPQAWLQRISDNITLIGSASASASSLAAAMLTNWKIDGAGPIPFPFAFYTGINQPFVMAYTGISGSGILILLVLLLVAGRLRHWTAVFVVGGLVAALAMANEIALLLLVLGFAIVVVSWIVQNRTWRLPRQLVWWISVLAISGVVAVLQGGLLTEIVRSRLFPAGGQVSYFDTSLSLVWPPAIVSAHLGSLSLANPAQLIAGLMEIGPVILVTPLIFVWAQKSYRRGNWYEAALIAASAGTLAALVVQFKGPLFTATPRLMGGWFFACILYAAPLLWIWARRRGGQLQSVLALGGLVTCLAGLVLFGIQLLAIQRPVLATFITPLDAKMSQNYWDRLRPGALIFDPEQFRAPTVFGRFTVSSPTWYTTDPKWQALKAAPSPHALRSAGFDYVYIGRDYWDALTPAIQSSFSTPCVKQIAEVVGIHSLQDYSKDYRRLLDIRTCQ